MPSKLTEPTNSPTAHTNSNRVSIALVIALIMVISWITSLTQVDWFQGQEYFSEFYIKDASRLLETNHLELSKNEEGTFAVVIVNHESVASNYRIHILVNGGQILTVDNIHLDDNGSSEAQIKFSFPTAGENQRVDILLEKQGASFPYRSLHLLVNVSSNGQDSP